MYKRIIQIIDQIVEDRNLSISELAGGYDVSAQTIRNDIKYLNKMLEKNDLQKIEISDGNIVRNKKFSAIKYYIGKQLEKENLYSYRLSKEEMSMLTTVILLFEQNYITINNLADRLSVSRTTFINNLPSLKEYLSSVHLTYSSSSKKGLILKNTEWERRQALTGIISELLEDNDFFLYLIRKSGIVLRENHHKIIDTIVQEIQQEFNIVLSKKSYSILYYYLIFMVEKIKRMQYVNIEFSATESNMIYAQEIMNHIATYCQIPVIETEVKYLAYVLETGIDYSMPLWKYKYALPLQFLTRTLIENVSHTIGIDLTQDYQLYKTLSNHLISIIDEDEGKLVMNPVLEDIKNNQTKLVEVVREYLPPIEIYYQRELAECELLYIVIHFNAAIERYKSRNYQYDVILADNDGVGISELIKTRLEVLNNIQIIRTIDSHEIDKLNEDDADLLISTIPIYDSPIEFVNVSRYIRNEDLVVVSNKIREMQDDGIISVSRKSELLKTNQIITGLREVIFNMVKENPDEVFFGASKKVREILSPEEIVTRNSENLNLYQLLTPEFIEIEVDCADWKDCIRKSGQILMDHEMIDLEYLEQIYKTTEEYGPYYVIAKGCAIPHSNPGVHCHKMGMSLIRLKNPVEFGVDDLDPITFVFMLGVVNKEDHMNALFHLATLLKKPEFIYELKQAQTPQEINRIIMSYEFGLIEGLDNTKKR